ncbi:hypothetical protein ACLB2K_048760 [Fragaria x ananassa]
MKPWENVLKDVKKGNERSKWMEREPYTYWKGNQFVAQKRRDLLKCNVSSTQDWNARLFIQDWILESQQGFKQSDVANQCTHRYKIYIEGTAWSVSEKYILACDSVTLLVKPKYYDFFTRSLQPMHHYWPIRNDNKCKSIKFAVDRGNNHKQHAQAIGKAASSFIQQELKMEYVYDYMFHLLNEYAKLSKFEPRVPKGATLTCTETLAFAADELEKKFMTESLVKSPSMTNPCSMPPSYEPQDLANLYRNNINSIKQVEKWEDKYWESIHNKQTGAKKRLASLIKGPPANTIFFLGFLIIAAILSSFWIHLSSTNQTEVITDKQEISPKVVEFPLNCSIGINQTQICPTNYPIALTTDRLDASSNTTCPDYFRFIHEDLKPWRGTGITRDMVENAKKTAHFRLVIVDGKAYVEKYKKSIQTRDVFTIWSILQLLRRYPGKVPDLELMFDCDDIPVIRSRDYRGQNSTQVPPLFRYCGDRWTKDIVFPDWSFWGWAEINIKPWGSLLKDVNKGNRRRKWMEREPYAYWKGNPFVAETRRDLLKCNVSDTQDWNARLFIQDWILESKQGFKQSDVTNQCTHRYKIYIEGYAWSVSEKYILACDSVTLLVKPNYYDFFTRSLRPVHHYWPIRNDNKCKSIKFAVDWGNNHKQKAQAIVKAASNFIQQELKMDYVYDYMFHLLSEYAKLSKFEPRIPEGATHLCAETLACPADESHKNFMTESLMKSPSMTSPCIVPPPYEPQDLGNLYRNNINLIKQVEKWEDKYWESIHNKQQ